MGRARTAGAGQGPQPIGGQDLPHVIYLLAALCGGFGLPESWWLPNLRWHSESLFQFQ
jgi:hypothetical protein